MSDMPFMPLYVADYLGDTRHLTTEQHGAYLLLLMTMWRAGGTLPADDGKLARIVGMSPARWRRIAGDVMAFFVLANGEVTQKRLAAEIEKSREKHQKRVDAGAAGGRAKSLKSNVSAPSNANSNAQAYARGLPEPEPEPDKKEEDASASLSESAVAPSDPSGPKGIEEQEAEPKPKRRKLVYSEAFGSFWSAYPRDALMSKQEAAKAFERLSPEDQAAASRSVPNFRAYCTQHPDYRPVHACRYLSQRRWEGFVATAPPNGLAMTKEEFRAAQIKIAQQLELERTSGRAN